jgi:hypothetical protein
MWLDIAVIGVASLAYPSDNIALPDELAFSNVNLRKVPVDSHNPICVADNHILTHTVISGCTPDYSRTNS